MGKFIRPHVFLKGNRQKSFGLIGQANSFLQRTLNWDSNKQFVHSLKLVDGSLITIQRLMNGEFLTFIESSIPTGGVEEVCRFFTAIDTYDGTDIDIISDEDTREPVIVSIDSSGSVSSEKAQPIIIDSEEEQIIAGNIDFKGKFTWQGPLGIDRPEGQGVIPPRLTFRPGGYFRAGLLKTFTSEHFSRFDTRIYSGGKILLDTVDNTIAPGELILGYCNSSNYQIAITWGGVTNATILAGTVSDDNKDNVWLIKNGVWTLLGVIEYYPDSDLDSFMLGRGQCITFSEDCTLFTGVTISSSDEDPSVVPEISILIKGVVNFNSSTNLPTSISVTLESTLSEDIIITTGGTTLGSPITHTNAQDNDYTLAYENTHTKTTTTNIVNKIPISSAYTSDNLLNVLYLNKSEIIEQIDGVRTAIDFDFFFVTDIFFTSLNSSSTYVTTTFKEYTTTSGKSFSYSTSQDVTLTSISESELDGATPKVTVLDNLFDILETEEGITELKYISLRDDIYIYDKIDTSNINLNGTFDYTLFDTSPLQVTEVIDRDRTSINYNLILNKANNEIIVLNRENEESLINTTNTVSSVDSILNPFISGLLGHEFFINTPPTLPARNFDATIGPSETRLANIFREEYIILFGLTNIKYSQSLFYTTCKDTGTSLLNYIGVSGRLFEIQGLDFSDVPRLNLTTAILRDNTLVPIDLETLYTSIGISPEPPLSRIWADRQTLTPALNNSNRDTAIGLL